MIGHIILAFACAGMIGIWVYILVDFWKMKCYACLAGAITMVLMLVGGVFLAFGV